MDQTNPSLGDEKPAGFYFSDKTLASQPEVNEAIRQSMRNYLVNVLGRSPQVAEELIELDLSRARAAATLDELERRGIEFRGKRVLDLGAGLGELSAELSSRGAIVFSMEPGETWRMIVRRRVNHEFSRVIAAVGEHLPYRDSSFDLIISLQVLEHVQDPESVLREAYRVCRPGGYFYFSCENYLSFREAHYQVFWLPLLPKPIGSLYLRLRGRSPDFLNTAVTYTTVPSVSRAISKSGFESERERNIAARVKSVEDIRTSWKKLILTPVTAILPLSVLAPLAISVERLSRTFDYLIYELLHKPKAT